MRNQDLNNSALFWEAMSNFMERGEHDLGASRSRRWYEYLEELDIALGKYGGRIDVLGDIHGDNDWVVSFHSQDEEAFFVLKFV